MGGDQMLGLLFVEFNRKLMITESLKIVADFLGRNNFVQFWSFYKNLSLKNFPFKNFFDI
jgi:hypothetical protein